MIPLRAENPRRTFALVNFLTKQAAEYFNISQATSPMNTALRYFWEIAIFHAILHAHILMLVIQVFDGFCETHCRETGKVNGI